MSAYYNEHDPRAAEWLRELIRAGMIAPGDVDERDIQDVAPIDLRGFTQCHFFAGIGGWSYALRLAEWPDDRQVWTGSCPCQPFSAAGRRMGAGDERHLWPYFARLIGQCRPPTVFGEQVASKDGREWLAGVFTDLEAHGYAVAGADLCAAGVGAPHIRQRLFWVGHSCSSGWQTRDGFTIRTEQTAEHVAASSPHDGLGDANDTRRERRRDDAGEHASERTAWPSGSIDGLGDAKINGRERRYIPSDRTAPVRIAKTGAWSDAHFLQCTDGKARRIEPGVEPLAHGIPGRVGLLRGYGNAIVPQVAATFIESVMEVI